MQEVIEVLLVRLLLSNGNLTRDKAIWEVATELIEHWTFQNIYTIAKVGICLNILS